MRIPTRSTCSIALLLAAAPSLAHANVAGARRSSAEADVAFAASDLAQISGDTGWFPSGSPAQLRLTGRVTGQTTVAMGLSPTVTWNDKLAITAPGRAQTGLLDSEYGAELHVYAQIHTSILGQSINWSGEIPIPYVPEDLLIAGTTTFDPTLLAGSDKTSVSVSDTTDRVVVVSTNLLTAVIDIIGISGGLNINVRGAMTTSFSTSSITLGAAAITTVDGTGNPIATTAELGPTLSLPVAAHGTVHYAPSLIFGVGFDVKIFGIRVVNIQLASVTMPLPPIDRSVDLTGADVALPLPHLGDVPASLGFAGGASQALHLHNAGAAPLMIELASAPGGVTASSITIDPGADGDVQVVAAETAAFDGPLVLASNDPNHPSLTIALDPTGEGQGGTTEPQAAGCNTGRGVGSLPVMLLALAFASRRRRSR